MRQWRRLAKAVWLQHPGAFFGLLVVYVALAATIVVGIEATRSTFSAYVADGCVTHPFVHSHACVTATKSFGDKSDPFTALVDALNVLPVVVGVFLGAPLVSRELESGTYRFAFTQALSRSRYVLTTLAMLAAFVAAGAVVLGLLFAVWAHPFELVGTEPMWQSGTFATSWFVLAAWSILGLAVGMLVGVLVRRVVMAMAGTVLIVGGLVVASITSLIPHLLSIAPLAAKRPTQIGLGVGVLGMRAFTGEGPPGAWLVRSWMTGRHGEILSQARAQGLVNALIASKGGTTSAATRHFLAVHHVTYWVSYQPAAREWIFQGAAGVVLLALGAIATAVTARRLRHLA